MPSHLLAQPCGSHPDELYADYTPCTACLHRVHIEASDWRVNHAMAVLQRPERQSQSDSVRRALSETHSDVFGDSVYLIQEFSLAGR